jgi:Contact-dependent growth inhibition CdiA C-terminal domain
MADGEIGAIVKGVAEDAAKAGEDIAGSVADVIDKTADTEEANLAKVLETEERNADTLSKLGDDEATAEGDAAGADPAGGGFTKPSGTPDPNATPGGRPTRIRPQDDADTQRSLQRENESATSLARQGYDVEQNPSVPGDKNPDYKIEGQVFDNYAPTTGNPRNIASWIQTKVDEGQADRIVLNLTDSSVDPARLSAQLRDWPIPRLKEVKVIDGSGHVIDFYP